MTSVLEAIKARGQARRARTEVLVNPDDAGERYVFDLPTDGEVMDRLVSASEREKRAKGILLNRAIVAQFCQQIERVGESGEWEPLELDGEPVNFRDKRLQVALGVADARAAVSAVIGNDGAVVAMAQELLRRAGYTSEDGASLFEDPTS